MTTPIKDRPRTTGADMQSQFARMKARLVSRYMLTAVPGRPEELVSPVTGETAGRGVSLGYGCRTIRVRLMSGREWIRDVDFQIAEPWQDKLDAMCDTYFDFRGEATMNRHTPEGATRLRNAEIHWNHPNTGQPPLPRGMVPAPINDQVRAAEQAPRPRPIRDNPQA